MNKVAVLRVAGNDADRSDLAAARDADQIRIGNGRREIETVESAADGVVAIRACHSARRIAVAENFRLNARKRRNQIGRWSGDVGQRLIARGAADAEGEQCCAHQVPIQVHLTS